MEPGFIVLIQGGDSWDDHYVQDPPKKEGASAVTSIGTECMQSSKMASANE